MRGPAVTPQFAQSDGQRGEDDRQRQRPQAEMDFQDGPGGTAGHEPDDTGERHAGPVSGTVFKVERGPAGEKVGYVRMFSGALRVRDRVPSRRGGERRQKARNQLAQEKDRRDPGGGGN